VVATSLGVALKQMGGAAERFEAVQAGAAQVSQEIAAAAQRFEGVDHGFSNSLSASPRRSTNAGSRSRNS